MNKKHAYIFASFLVYNLAMFSSAPATNSSATPPSASAVTEVEPVKFTEQLSEVGGLLLKNIASSIDYIRSCYNQHILGEEPPKKPDPIKPSNNDPYFTKNQQYLVASTALCVIVAGIIYKYDLLASKNEESITAEEVQELVEMVVHNSAISKQDQLNKVFELLIGNGLDNIVVYNDHMFEVNDMFKVEIKGKAVKVTRS